ncbi:triple QxxK/R motif-containing protein-like [Acanthaster planci]|uniref:Triple QxxK/R motif-containing protein n=1 Tax=Acanthaster planci TaxID=133434 RepID=A0A8B7YUL4_ACAPL|nr:triple QxxK/R motif-containing protein-like [Acanthaster planci]
MGKKDAQRCTLPVDQYRKNIGKQDYKRSKKDLIRSKREADRRKTSTGFRDSMLVMLALCAVVCLIYMFFYLQMPPKT